MTLRSGKRDSVEINSSDMPSEKYSLAASPVEFVSGRTAMDFSGTALFGPARCKTKYPAPAASRTMTMMTVRHGIRFGLATGGGVGAGAAIWRNFSGDS